MSYTWPILEQNEIISPNNGHIKWNLKTGSTVRIGQLLATSSTSDSEPPPSSSLQHLASNSVTVTENDTKVDTAKPTTIRARRIKRKVKPTPSASSSSLPSSSYNNGKSTEIEGDQRKRSHPSFLGQYLKNSTNADRPADSQNIVTETKVAPLSTASNGNGTAAATTALPSEKQTLNSEEIRAHIDGFLRIFVTVQCRRDPNNSDKLTYVLGKIEPCTHPAIIDGLCAVCGQRASTIGPSGGSTQINGDGNEPIEEKKHDSLTLSGGVTVSISTEYGQTFSTDTSQSLRAAKKLNLVLDLDHTLLHATADRRAASWLGKCKDLHTLSLPIMEGHPMQQGGGGVAMVLPHFVKLRPHLAEFLCAIRDQYEISIYTAGTRMYAEKIADVISRHLADHLRRKEAKGASPVLNENGGENGNRCLDEGELNLMRETVARTKEKLSWYKSQKERQEYVAKLNEDFRLQQEKTEEMKQTEATASEKVNVSSKGLNGESSSDDGGTHMLAGDEESTQEVKPSNGKKRKRVTFKLPDENETGENGGASGKDTDGLKSSKRAKGGDSVLHLEDPSEALEKLQQKLKLGEKREIEAQNLRKKIFGSRIISRDDVGDLGRDVKSLKRVFPCGGMMAVIIDDREDVWANASNNSTGRKGEPPDNLMLVRPYHWKPFQKYADVNNSAGEDLTAETDKKKSDGDTSIDEHGENQLTWTGDILKRIHDRYYDSSFSEAERDKFTVPSILKQMRHEVFGHSKPPTKFLLSGLVPLHKQNLSSDYRNTPRPLVVRYAEELGAEIVSDVSKDLTHIVAARDGTDKVLRARRIPGCAIVKVNWLMECYWSCSLRGIQRHILGPMPVPAHHIKAEPKRILLSGSDSSEDDEFFDDFEKEMIQ